MSECIFLMAAKRIKLVATTLIHEHVNQWHDGSHRHMDMSARLCGRMHGVFFKTIFLPG